MSLSQDRVMELLNAHFVPVYTSNEDYAENGSAPPEEKAELRRIHQEGYQAKLSVGSVHAYVLAPEGRLLASLHTAEAAKPERLIAMLEWAVRELKTPAGKPVLTPHPPPAPRPNPGELRLHLTARYLEKRGEEYALTGQGENRGNWGDLPSVDWILLKPTQWKKLLPPKEARPGAAWDIAPTLAVALLRHFYPPTENSDLEKNRIETLRLRATLITRKNGLASIRLEGALKMKHPFYHQDDDRFVTATLAGFLETDARQVRKLHLVTDDALYTGGGSALPFGVALRALPGG